jgi:DNA polymerase elongation subunit (family B)
LDKYDLNTVCKKFIGRAKHDIKAPEMFTIYEDIRRTKQALLISQDEATQVAYNKALADMTRVMEYCIQDSELVIELMEKLNIWVSLVEMSNIVGTSIVELSTRGQQIRCVSQIYDLAAQEGYVLNKRIQKGFKYTGGAVHEPISGLHENVICLDFASLYPSIIRAYNICFTTLVSPEMMHSVPDEDCNIIEFDQEELWEARE